MPADLNLPGDLAIDSEAMGLNNKRDRLCVIQLSNGNGDAHLVKFERGVINAPNLKNILQDAKRCKIFHYARFDVAIIKHYLGVDLENVYCTKIASRIVRTYTDSHSLKELCRELLGVNLSKQQQSSYWGDAALSKEQIEYAASDVFHLHAIRDRLNIMLEREGRTKLAYDCFKFISTRVELDLDGWGEVDIFAH